MVCSTSTPLTYRFIPAALTARPWDFGEETLRDHKDNHDIVINPADPSHDPVVRVSGPNGDAKGVVVGVGRAPAPTPSQPTSPGAPIKGGKKGEMGINPPNADGVIHTQQNFTVLTTSPSHLAQSLPPLEGALTPPGSADSSAASTPELEVWVKPKSKRSPILLSASRFKRSKQKGKPPPIDSAKANSVAPPHSPTIDSDLPSPATLSAPSPTTPSADASLVTLADHFTAGTLRLLRGTLGRRRSKIVKDAECTKTDEGEEAVQIGMAEKKKGMRHGRSLFELRRFYNRSM